MKREGEAERDLLGDERETDDAELCRESGGTPVVQSVVAGEGCTFTVQLLSVCVCTHITGGEEGLVIGGREGETREVESRE